MSRSYSPAEALHAYAEQTERFTAAEVSTFEDAERVIVDLVRRLGEEKEKNERDTLNALAEDIHRNAVAHGWWDDSPSFGEIVALCHSELSEALERFRDGEALVHGCCGHCGHEEQCEQDVRSEGSCKPEGVAVEMVDCIMRILDWCAHEGVDVDEILRLKHEYNRTRPYRHGGKAL